MQNERSIQDVVSLTGLTSRALRHYDQIGLLTPTRVAAGGQRWYDEAALVTLQRILMLRQLGLGLPDIRRVLDADTEPADALEAHARWLRAETARLEKQLDAVTETITALRDGGPLMAEKMFEGFDHTQYREEVEERWSAAAYASSDQWWRAKTAAQKADFQSMSARLAADWVATAASGALGNSPEAQALAHRQWEWVTNVPGVPGYGGDRDETTQYFLGLAEMYAADERFAANYGGLEGAQFVRDAMREFVERMPAARSTPPAR